MKLAIQPGSAVAGGAIALAAFLALGMQQTGSVQRILTLTPEQEEILSHMSIVYLDDGQGGQNKTVRFTGVNLQIVSGSGGTEGPVNGLGNLIVGYNELGNLYGDTRTGSHNIVGGAGSSYSSSGGLVVGRNNTVSAPFATVTGGQNNRATQRRASVAGGVNNLAAGFDAFVGGGLGGCATGQGTAILGGYENSVSGQYASVAGGEFNQSTAPRSSVCGGRNNIASGSSSTVSGGEQRTAPGLYDWVAGSLFEDN